MSEPTLATANSEQHKQRVWQQMAVTLIGLAILTCAIACREITIGGLSWSDAPLHTMDGVFVHDLVREWPSGSWRAWAEDYYLRHQCLGIGVYYPPLFAAVEAIVFTLLGISVFAARLTVVLFVVGAVWLIYLIGRELFGNVAGIFAAVLALTTPSGVAWSRQVMLEWPSVFCIALAVLAYVRLARGSKWGWGVAMFAGCVGAYLAKQTAGFVIGVIVLHAVLFRDWQVIRRPAFYVSFIVAAAAIFAYGSATAGMNVHARDLVAGTTPWRHVRMLDHWTWYVVRFPHMFGWPALIALGAAIPTYAFQRQEARAQLRAIAVPALWAFCWWLISTLIEHKEERYFFFAVPALALLAGAGMAQVIRRRTTPTDALGVVAVTVLTIGVVVALRTPAMRLGDTKPTVAYLMQQADADLVLVDAVRDGQLIFDVRLMEKTTGPSKIIPMRASKLLYSRAGRTTHSYSEYVKSPENIIAILDRLGMRYIVLEDRLPTASRPGEPVPDEDRSWDTPPRVLLRELLKDSSRFERVFSQPMKCGDPIWDDVNLVTYRYKNAPTRQTNTVSIPVPAMGKSVELKLKQN